MIKYLKDPKIKSSDIIARYSHILDKYGVDTKIYDWLKITSETFDEHVAILEPIIGALWKEPQFHALFMNSKEYILKYTELLKSIGADKELYYLIAGIKKAVDRYKLDDAKELVNATRRIKQDPESYFELERYFQNMAQFFAFNHGYTRKLSRDSIKEFAKEAFFYVFSKCKNPEKNPALFLALVAKRIFSQINDEFRFKSYSNLDAYQVSNVDEDGNTIISPIRDHVQY